MEARAAAVHGSDVTGELFCFLHGGKGIGGDNRIGHSPHFSAIVASKLIQFL